MTHSLAASEQERTSGSSPLPQPEGDRLCTTGQPVSVSKVRHSSLTDPEREAAIKRAAELVEWFMGQYLLAHKRWAAFGNFVDKADADNARTRADHARVCMEALIRGRSAEQVRQMERERGIA